MIKNLSNAVLSVECILQLFSISIVARVSRWNRTAGKSTTYISDVLDVVIRSHIYPAFYRRNFSHGASHMQSNERRFMARDFTLTSRTLTYVRARIPSGGISSRDNAKSLTASSFIASIFLRYDWTCATRSDFHVEKTRSERMLRSSDNNIWFLWDSRCLECATSVLSSLDDVSQ